MGHCPMFTDMKNLDISQVLVQEGVLTRSNVERAKTEAQNGEILEETLIRLGYLSEEDLINCLEKHLQLKPGIFAGRN